MTTLVLWFLLSSSFGGLGHSVGPQPVGPISYHAPYPLARRA